MFGATSPFRAGPLAWAVLRPLGARLATGIAPFVAVLLLVLAAPDARADDEKANDDNTTCFECHKDKASKARATGRRSR